MSVGAAVFIVAPLWRRSGTGDRGAMAPRLLLLVVRRTAASLQLDPIELVVGRHVGQDHLIAWLQAFLDLDGVDRAPSELHVGANRLAVGLQLEQADRALFLSERRPPHVNHVVELLESDRASTLRSGREPGG